METMTARQFNQDVGKAKRLAASAPLLITDRGKPSIVLLSYRDYERLHHPKTLLESLQTKDDIDFNPPRLQMPIREAELDD